MVDRSSVSFSLSPHGDAVSEYSDASEGDSETENENHGNTLVVTDAEEQKGNDLEPPDEDCESLQLIVRGRCTRHGVKVKLKCVRCRRKLTRTDRASVDLRADSSQIICEKCEVSGGCLSKYVSKTMSISSLAKTYSGKFSND